jgi:hypothetical protein
MDGSNGLGGWGRMPRLPGPRRNRGVAARKAQSRIFQQKTVPDILKVVRKGIQVDYRLQSQYHPRDDCVQSRETDFAFASRLMEKAQSGRLHAHPITPAQKSSRVPGTPYLFQNSGLPYLNELRRD